MTDTAHPTAGARASTTATILNPLTRATTMRAKTKWALECAFQTANAKAKEDAAQNTTIASENRTARQTISEQLNEIN